MKNQGLHSRRQFLGTCGKMSSLPFLSSLLQLRMLNAAVSNNTSIGNDYKALVCVFLSGGNDSFNMLTPWTYNHYLNYLEARQHLALQRDNNELLPIVSNNSANMAHLGIHHDMPDVRDLYNQRDLAFVANVGTLVRPTTAADVLAGNALPRGLYSHREQQLSWQTSVPQNTQARGWIGRMTELINDTDSSNNDVSLSFSLNGASRLLTGENTNPFIISANGANGLNLYEFRSDIRDAYNTTLDHQYQNVIKNHYGYKFKEIVEQAEFYNDTVTSVGDPFDDDLFPNTGLANQLKQVARTINAKSQLGAKRQTFIVSLGGFDFHSELLVNQANRMAELNDALAAFSGAMKQLNLNDNVTAYTASDFGRTIAPNSTGTDHAWGGNQMVMGGAVNGRKVYGEYPSDLRVGASNLDTGRGRFIPSTSVDEFHAELATWYGVGLNDLPTILPNIGNFNYSPMGLLNV